MVNQYNSFRTSDGVTLRYEDAGSGPTVVLVHGFSSRASHWAFQRGQLLAAGYRTIALDLRMHGGSEPSQHGQRISRLGQDVHELMEHLNLQELALVGHSMGVSVNLAYVDLYGADRLVAFVAIDQSPKIINDPTWTLGLRGIGWENLWAAVNGRIQWGEPSLEPPMPAHVLQLLEQEGGLTAFPEGSVLPLLVDHFTSDWRDVLPRIDVPSWVATGRNAPGFPLESMQWIAENLPEGKLTVFENSGHCPHWNEPEEFNRGLLDFLQPVMRPVPN